MNRNMPASRVNLTSRWVLLAATALLASLALAVRPAAWQHDVVMHTMLELAATMLALMIGVVALIRFYTRQETLHLFIGVGFLGAALFDGQHMILTSPWWLAGAPPSEQWNWNPSLTFLALELVFGWWTCRREQQVGQGGRAPDNGVYLRLAVVTLVSFAVAAFVPFPRRYSIEGLLGRPDELLAGLLFLIAMLGFMRLGEKSPSVFLRWLVFALLIAFVGRVFVMSRSNALLDALFMTGHWAKLATYVCVLVGLLIDFYSLSAEAQRRQESLAQAVGHLRLEVSERERAQGESLTAHQALESHAAELASSRAAALNAWQDLEVSRRQAVKSEQATRELAARIQAILDGVSDAIITINLEGIIEWFNLAAERTFGYTAAEAVGKNIKFLMPPPYFDEHDQYLRNYVDTGVTKVIGIGREVVGLRSDGQTFPMDLAVSEVRLGDQRCFTGIVRDISKLKHTMRQLTDAHDALQLRAQELDLARRISIRAEQTAHDQAARTQAILDGAFDAVITINSAGIIESFNAAAEHVFGYTAVEAVGQNVSILMPPPYDGEHDQHLRDYLETGVQKIIGIRREVVGRRADGSTLPMQLGVSEVKLGGQRIFTGIVRDVSDIKAAMQQVTAANDELARRSRLIEQFNVNLSRSNEELKQFAYIASHDLQEPLRKVTSFCQLLSDDYGERLDDNARTYIQYAVDGALRMKALIQDLLTYSRVDTQGKPLEPTSADDACAEAIDNLTMAIKESGAKITRDPLPVVKADRAQLARLFQNLIGNAIKYRGDEPPRIHVGATESNATESNGTWEFRVRDNGIGIDPQYYERIFVIFQRLHGRDEYSGTGIGLAVCKRIVERAGGRIWVESNNGAGSIFCFTLSNAISALPQGTPPHDQHSPQFASSTH